MDEELIKHVITDQYGNAHLIVINQDAQIWHDSVVKDEAETKTEPELETILDQRYENWLDIIENPPEEQLEEAIDGSDNS